MKMVVQLIRILFYYRSIMNLKHDLVDELFILFYFFIKKIRGEERRKVKAGFAGGGSFVLYAYIFLWYVGFQQWCGTSALDNGTYESGLV